MSSRTNTAAPLYITLIMLQISQDMKHKLLLS